MAIKICWREKIYRLYQFSFFFLMELPIIFCNDPEPPIITNRLFPPKNYCYTTEISQNFAIFSYLIIQHNGDADKIKIITSLTSAG